MSPAAAQSLCEGRQAAHTTSRAGPWLSFPSMTQPSHQTQCLCCHETFRHTTPEIPGNVHTRMSESSRCGGGTCQVPLEKNPPHHGGGKPSGCLSTTQHPWQSVILENPSSHLIHPDASPSDLQKNPLIPATISPAERTPAVTFVTLFISHLF